MFNSYDQAVCLDVKFLDYLLQFRLWTSLRNILTDGIARNYLKYACLIKICSDYTLYPAPSTAGSKILQNIILSKIMQQQFQNIHSFSRVQISRLELL